MIINDKERIIDIKKPDNIFSGEVIFKHIINKDILNNLGRVYSEVTIKPNSEVKFHTHINEFEIYHIIKGKGLYNDNNIEEKIVGPNDVTYCPTNTGHAIKNISEDEDLVFIALILSDIN